MSEAKMENPPRDIESRIAELREMFAEMGGINGVVMILTRNKELVEKVEEMKLERDKIRILQSVFHWTPSSATKHKFQKSSAKSRQYEGNAKAFATNSTNTVERIRAVNLANMIIAFAEDARDLALGHFTRSQIFVYFGRQEACKIFMKDEVESALKILKENPRPSLHSDSMLETEDVEEFLRELSTFLKTELAISNFARLDKKKKEYIEFIQGIFSLKSPNKKAPALEDFVEIRYNSSRGRHVVVTKDVPVGTTLLVEKPFLSGLTNILKLEIGYCHNCYRHNFKPTPCPNCVFVLFCSDKCQEEAQNYHKYECPCFPDLHDILSTIPENNQSRWLTAFKLVCSLGPLELYRQFEKENEAKKSASPSDVSAASSSDGSNLMQGFDPLTGIFDPSSFHTARHVQRLNQPFSFQNILLAVGLTRVIETRTDFFQFPPDGHVDQDPETNLEFKNYVTELLFQQYDTTIFYVVRSGSYRAAIFPTALLFSHSCDPNVIQCSSCYGDGPRIAKVAARDLKAGEELCISYTKPFYTMEKSERQKPLTAFHRFECDCPACSNDWPVMTKELEGFRNVNPVFCCVNPNCSKSTSKGVKKTPLVLQKGGKNLKCPVCNLIYEEEKLFRTFLKHLNTLEKALNLIEEDDGLKAVKDVLAASTFFQKNFQPPSVHQIKCREILGKVFGNSYMDFLD